MLQYVYQNKKFNQVYYNMMTIISTFEVVVQCKNLTFQSGGEGFKSSHIPHWLPRLPWFYMA